MNYIHKGIMVALLMITSPIMCHLKQSIDYVELTNSTDHVVKNIKVRFMFIGANDASDQHHLKGKVFISRLKPGQTITVDPKKATHVGLINPVEVYKHFDNPRILLHRIDSRDAHRGFGKRGSDEHTNLEFITHREKDIIRSKHDTEDYEGEIIPAS